MIKDTNIEQKILQAARKVFIRKGYANATMQEIAEEAGTSRPALHYYFRSKEKLFEAIFDGILAINLPPVVGTLISYRPFPEKMAQFVSFYMDVLWQNPYLPTFICSEMQHGKNIFIQKIKEKHLRPDRLFRVLNYQLKKAHYTITAEHLILNAVSLCAFPFVMQPLVMEFMSGGNKKANRQFLEERKNIIVEFINNALSHEKNFSAVSFN